VRGPIIPYNPLLKERAQILRQNMTRAEVLLWTKLKAKQMCGYDFDRQRPLDEYIVDFYCKELHLAIEIDGWSHALKGARDVARQNRLESLGVRFLRFTEQEVVADLQSVTDQIEMWIHQQTEREPTPNPSEGGEQVVIPKLGSTGKPTLGPSRGGEQRARKPTPEPSNGGERTTRRPTPDPSEGGE
jgi:very-short-patch-repair endonuclease